MVKIYESISDFSNDYNFNLYTTTDEECDNFDTGCFNLLIANMTLPSDISNCFINFQQLLPSADNISFVNKNIKRFKNMVQDYVIADLNSYNKKFYINIIIKLNDLHDVLLIFDNVPHIYIQELGEILKKQNVDIQFCCNDLGDDLVDDF